MFQQNSIVSTTKQSLRAQHSPNTFKSNLFFYHECLKRSLLGFARKHLRLCAATIGAHCTTCEKRGELKSCGATIHVALLTEGKRAAHNISGLNRTLASEDRTVFPKLPVHAPPIHKSAILGSDLMQSFLCFSKEVKKTGARSFKPMVLDINLFVNRCN